MFSCCGRMSGDDSGLRKSGYGCLFQAWRGWSRAWPPVQHLSIFSTKKSMETQGNSGERDSDSGGTVNVPCNVWSPEAGLLEMLVMNLVPAHQKGDLFFLRNFLHNYRLCGTMEQVLTILFRKYKSLRPNCEEDEKVKDTLCSIFTIWMDFSPDDFYDRKNRDVLNELMFYVMLNMPSSDLLLRLHILLDQLEEPVTCQTKSKAGESLCRRLRAYLGLQNAVTPELMT
ncbi:ral guanine nucleotide dissociation stimulator-like isoform 1-T1 [Thomomys bottae]